MSLRPYQQRSVDEIRAKLASCQRGALLVKPTGGGKTRTAAALLASTPGRIACLAHSRKLVTQIKSALTAVGRGDIYVDTWQRATKRPPRHVDLLVIDEAHRAAPGTKYAKLCDELRLINPHFRVLGLTATPFRLDGKGLLGHVFDDYYVAATPSELLDLNVLVPVEGYAYASVNTDGVAKSKGDYAVGELGARAAKISGDIVAEWVKHASQMRTLVFACNIPHAESLMAEFRAVGVSVEICTGKTGDSERVFARLQSGQTQVVVNVNIATEGVDVPELECLILARPTMSEALALQMIGRVLRSAPGKLSARIHDHANIWLTHGGPYDERDWTPKLDRQRGSAGAGAQMVCPDCCAVISASSWTCKFCGHVFRTLEAPEASDGVAVPLGSSEPVRQTESWKRTGITIDGTYLGSTDEKRFSWQSKTRYVGKVHLFKTDNAEVRAQGCADLDTQLSAVTPGARVQVRYDGTADGRKRFTVTSPMTFKRLTPAELKNI